MTERSNSAQSCETHQYKLVGIPHLSTRDSPTAIQLRRGYITIPERSVVIPESGERVTVPKQRVYIPDGSFTTFVPVICGKC